MELRLEIYSDRLLLLTIPIAAIISTIVIPTTIPIIIIEPTHHQQTLPAIAVVLQEIVLLEVVLHQVVLFQDLQEVEGISKLYYQRFNHTDGYQILLFQS